MKFFTIWKIIGGSLFKKPATKTANAPVSPILRGSVENDVQKCIFCSICAKKCPTDAIVVDKTAKSWEIDRFRCIVCNSCVEVCPKKCLAMRTDLSKAAFEKYSDRVQCTSSE